MTEAEAIAYCLARAREQCHGCAASYWLAVVRACERMQARTQGNRG